VAYRSPPDASVHRLEQLRATLVAEVERLRRLVGERRRRIRGQGLEGELQALRMERDRLSARAQFRQALRRGALIDSRDKDGGAKVRWRDWILEVALDSLLSFWL
jgi:hypothetical protein